MRFFTLGLLAVCVQAADPVAPRDAVALHGELLQLGQTQSAAFWANLKAPDAAFAGQRMLQLVYTPPSETALSGTVLVDHPFVLVDQSLRVVAWNGREGLAQITHLKAGGYRVVREIISGKGIEARGEEEVHTVSSAPAWDLRLAPLLLALTWTAGSEGEVPAVDFYGDRSTSVVRWTGTAVMLGAVAATVEPDAAGRVARLVATDGRVLIAIATP